MVMPVSSSLGTLMSSMILMVGGTVMCFVTSWRLAILAICSIGPIIYITGIYAVWSQNINREIWVALADASSVATEGTLLKCSCSLLKCFCSLLKCSCSLLTSAG